ncbi:MAG: tripartite tricarboxylate transporter substrate binding protein [Betaproteobacteria bacterium]|nr:tripartite tricarboxylate transporter substrate binding protein [Betaproteobacteria bacterium]
MFVTMLRRLWSALPRVLAILLLSAPSIFAAAKDVYPSKLVRIIYASGAGTSGDVRTRLLAEKLSARLGQRFIVENKPGAATTLATKIVADAKPDGYVLLATFTPALPVGPLLYKDAGYDPIASFSAIAIFAQGSPFLVVHPSVPAKTVKEFVALAKAKPGSIAFAHAGLGNATHLPAEMFRRATGVDVLYVPYKSEAHALPDLLSGQVSAAFAYTVVAVPQIKAGKLRALAVARAERNPALPDVPTLAEAGYPGCEFHATMLLLGPAGLPGEIISLLNKEIAAIMQEQEVRSFYETTGADPVYGTPEQVRALIARETEMNIALVKALDIKPE